MGLVDESGCAQPTAALAALRALPRNGAIRSGQVLVDGQDITALGPAGLRQLRLRKVSMVYQDPGRRSWCWTSRPPGWTQPWRRRCST